MQAGIRWRSLKRHAQVGLDTSSGGGVGSEPESILACRCIEAGESVSIGSVEELHSEDSRDLLCEHGNFLREVPVFIEVGELANSQGARRITKGEVRRRCKGCGVKSPGLSINEASIAAGCGVWIDVSNDVRTTTARAKISREDA